MELKSVKCVITTISPTARRSRSCRISFPDVGQEDEVDHPVECHHRRNFADRRQHRTRSFKTFALNKIVIIIKCIIFVSQRQRYYYFN